MQSQIDFLKSALAERFQRAVSTIAISTNLAKPTFPGVRGTIAQLMSGGASSIPPTANSRNLLTMYRSNAWVHMLVNKIALSASMCEFYLEDAAGQRVNDHEALDFLRSGSEFLTALQSGVVHYAYMDLVGDSFWLIGRGSDGKPASYLPVPPTWVLDVPNGSVDGKYIVSPPNSTPIDVDAKDMFWFKNPDPVDPMRRGTSLTRAANMEIQVEAAATNHLYSFLKNRARPDLMIMGTATAPMQETDVRRLEEAWLPRFQGTNNAGKPFFSAAELSVKEIGASMRDHEMATLRKDETDYIAQLYGVPPEIFGRVTNSNRATIEGADYLYNSHVISPRVKMTVSILDARLRYEFQSMRGLKLRHESPIKENLELALKAMVAGPWAFKVNDYRAVAGMPPLPGEDGQARPPMPTKVDPTSSGTSDTGSAQKPNTNVAPKKKALQDSNVIRKALSVEDIVDICAGIDEIDGEDADPDAMTLAYLFDLECRHFGQIVDESYEPSAAAALWIAEAIRTMSDQIDETTTSLVRLALDDMADEQSTKSELIGYVRGVFASWSKSRAKLISITEMSGLGSYTIVNVLQKLNETEKVWRTRRDEKVRDQHEPMEGQTVPIGQAFTAPNGDKAMHPGGFTTAAQNAHCRCVAEGKTHTVNHEAYQAALQNAALRIEPEIQSRFQRQLQSVIARIDAL